MMAAHLIRCLVFYCLLTVPVLGVSFWYAEPWRAHLFACFIVFFFVLLLFVACYQWLFAHRTTASSSASYGSVVFVWLGASLLSSGVWLVYPHQISWVDAFFASVSGLTTTGTEVFTTLSDLPRSLLFFRMWLQFLGGLGIILMAMSAFSSSGAEHAPSGFRVDLPGPLVSYSKKKPCISEMSRYLWLLYAVAALLCAFCLRVLGLSWFESVCESFSVLSTGGYRLYDAGVAHYHSLGVQWVMVVFMLFSSINYLNHYHFFILREPIGYHKSYEFRAYICATLTLVILLWAVAGGAFGFTDVVFSAVAMISSSGFEGVPVFSYPSFLPVLLIFVGLMGGCAGSTSGGIKVIRVLFCFQEIKQACRLMIHPRLVLRNPANIVGLSGSLVEDQVLLLRGFLSGWSAFFMVSVLILVALGLSFENAFFAVCACLSNTGVFLSTDGTTVAQFSDAVKLWLAVTMLFGRIEILAFFMLLSPQYWLER